MAKQTPLKAIFTNGVPTALGEMATGDTLDAGIVEGPFLKQQYAATATLTDGATISWDVSQSQVAKVTLGGNRTMAAPTNLVDGAFYSLAVYQDATGSRTLTWNSVFKFVSGTAPMLSTGANAKDFFVFKSDGTNLYEQGRAQAVA
jgi:hypothetical protein